MSEWERRVVTISCAFNVFFAGRTLMRDPETLVPPHVLGWVVIVLLSMTAIMVLFPIPRKIP